MFVCGNLTTSASPFPPPYDSSFCSFLPRSLSLSDSLREMARDDAVSLRTREEKRGKEDTGRGEHDEEAKDNAEGREGTNLTKFDREILPSTRSRANFSVFTTPPSEDTARRNRDTDTPIEKHTRTHIKKGGGEGRKERSKRRRGGGRHSALAREG